VQEIRSELEVLPVTESTKRVGIDGVTRTVPQPKLAKETEKTAKTAADDVLIDPLSDFEPPDINENPEPVKNEKNTIAEIESIAREIDQLNRRLDDLKTHPLAYSLHFPTIIPKMKEVREMLWQGRAIHDDPYCKGTGDKKGEPCKVCRGTGKVIASVNKSGTRAVGPVGDAA
jgi:hypothetical protein